ncbi:MAG TPA: SDR family NAD(P)-dependent oxidoreductase [Methanoregulaceae archaeon]|nr:MAG: SDR family NAD(P)-dependent oxidoreductase [Methanolinea sp.]HON80959.1 SDR family NAD(P)-dependent oxidoreductase [Methanoregulaceae archaeon]HPD09699.1 SDR family NAD(P)-dependent oxidoreductase [Methanoregulaceae archaeon]HRT15731.1 SDR family NAD(P)-dependent oxidoreductase [Methanoregulaceae archaeon]HRU31189.1 SDR family NAD(P)-dependent oxidoreductase [Methanoregulaceae archaeon]
MDNTDYYQNKICNATGANSGIGYALSEVFLERGATVCMARGDQEKVAAAFGQLTAFGDRVRTLIVDVTERQQVPVTVERAAAGAGRLGIFRTEGRFTWFLPNGVEVS